MTLTALEQSLVRAAGILAESTSCVSFTGAGLSAESGVATFRDAQTGGLWSKQDPMRLASPQGFEADPTLVIDWYAHRRRLLAKAQPNPAHRSLADRRDMLHITQNVDDLLHRAGADPARIVQLHGSITSDRCHGNARYVEPIDLTDPPLLRESPVTPGAYMRPAVVWFGESLPSDAWDRAERACRCCDVLLVIGTSASVHPAAQLIAIAKSSGAAIIIVNTHESEASHLADIELIGKAGELVPRLLDHDDAMTAS